MELTPQQQQTIKNLEAQGLKISVKTKKYDENVIYIIRHKNEKGKDRFAVRRQKENTSKRAAFPKDAQVATLLLNQMKWEPMFKDVK